MQRETNSSQTAICPKLYYDDAVAAIDWLVRAFGFKKRLVVPGANGVIVHAELSLGAGVIMVGSSRPEQQCVSPRRLTGVSHVLCVHVEDPDAHHAHAMAAGAEIVNQPSEESNGSRSYGAKDIEGNQWHFGTYVPGTYWTD